MNQKALIMILCLSALSATGCITVQPQTHFEAVQKLSQDRGQRGVVWAQTQEAQQRYAQQSLEIIQDGLTRDESAQVAILNNRMLQAELEELGLAAADLTQAKLPRNPSLDALVVFPLSLGNSGLGLLGWLSDVWQLPRQRRVAEIAAYQSEYQAAWHVLLTAFKGAHAWDEVVATRQLFAIEKELLEVRRQTVSRIRIRYGHGLADTSEMQEVIAMEAEQHVNVRSAEQSVTQAETLLAQVLAADGAAGYVSASDLEVLPQISSATEEGIGEIIQDALDNRFDLAAAQAEIEKMVEQQKLERALIWKSVSIGPGWEGDFRDIEGGQNSIGPALSIELPIFDQNQAGRAAASYGLRQAIRRLESAQRIAIKEVVDLSNALNQMKASLEIFENEVLPATLSSLRYTKEWNHKMQLPFMNVLGAQSHHLETQRGIIRTRKKVNDSWRSLQLARFGGSPPRW